jgi:outer membrane protease
MNSLLRHTPIPLVLFATVLVVRAAEKDESASAELLPRATAQQTEKCRLFGLDGAPGDEPSQVVAPKHVLVEPAPKKGTLVTLGVGHLQASAKEFVYGGPGPGDGQLSQLNWNSSHAVALQLGLSQEIFPRLALFTNAVYGYEGHSEMVDYDWLGLDVNWTDRSQHDDTSLEHYFQGDIGLSYTLLDWPSFQFALRAGFRYTDIAWAAHGGSYIYSTLPPFTFRDDRGHFPDGQLGIAYRQQFPGVFLGPQIAWSLGRWTLRGGGLAGMTISASDRDRHWASDSIFVEEFDQQAFFGANLGVDYTLKNALTLFLEGCYDKYPVMKGSMEHTDLTTQSSTLLGGASAGASLETWQIRGGAKIAF